MQIQVSSLSDIPKMIVGSSEGIKFKILITPELD